MTPPNQLRNRTIPKGRFAPSPTGSLHFGSLVAAVASFLQAKSANGSWLLRIEDIDPPREVPGSARSIIADLQKFGMQADEEVLWQSTRRHVYESACRSLFESGLAYWCGCSRADLPAAGPYPGTCRNGLAPGREPRSLRLRTTGERINFVDLIHGPIDVDIQHTCGDFVIRRADGLPAYQLAVVIDDAFQEIDQVVRGADLLDSTGRQILLQRLLGFPQPVYAHIPLALGVDGAKLSKRGNSDPINRLEPVKLLKSALAFLGHEALGESLPEIWDWALRNWSLDRIPCATVPTNDSSSNQVDPV